MVLPLKGGGVLDCSGARWGERGGEGMRLVCVCQPCTQCTGEVETWESQSLSGTHKLEVVTVNSSFCCRYAGEGSNPSFQEVCIGGGAHE